MSNYRHLLTKTVEKLSESNSYQGLFHQYKDGEPLPSGKTLHHIIDLARSILFPGYFGNSTIHSQTIQYHIGVNIEELFALLTEQIQAGLCFGERNIEQKLGEFIVKLPRLNGDINMLIQIMSTIHDKELLDSMNELKTLYEKMNMKNQDLFDLAFVPNMEYYTGIVFKVYSQYSSEAIISGGRYDALYGSFGKETPAIGMAYYLDNILKAIERAGEKNG